METRKHSSRMPTAQLLTRGMGLDAVQREWVLYRGLGAVHNRKVTS